MCKENTETDERLLELYRLGFSDELNGVDQSEKYSSSAYSLGQMHAIVGDEITSIDQLTNEEILELIKK